MKNREGFTLEPSKSEQEIIEKLKDNPKGYVEDQVRSEMERRFSGMSASDLQKYTERSSQARMGMIESFLSVHDFAVRKCERMTNEKLHESFHSAAQKTDLIGRVMDKVIKSIKQGEQLTEDKEKIKKAKQYRGSRDHAPDTLHYGD